MPFRIIALDLAAFAPLFDLDEGALKDVGARRVVADASPGYPCRVSLADAEVGETLLLLNHEHQSADTPFRSRHAIFVRNGVARADPAAGEVPAMLARRLLSVRAFDAEGMMRAAEVTPGEALAPLIAAMLADPIVAELHLHTARQGCYLARAIRA